MPRIQKPWRRPTQPVHHMHPFFGQTAAPRWLLSSPRRASFGSAIRVDSTVHAAQRFLFALTGPPPPSQAPHRGFAGGGLGPAPLLRSRWAASRPWCSCPPVVGCAPSTAGAGVAVVGRTGMLRARATAPVPLSPRAWCQRRHMGTNGGGGGGSAEGPASAQFPDSGAKRPARGGTPAAAAAAHQQALAADGTLPGAPPVTDAAPTQPAFDERANDHAHTTADEVPAPSYREPARRTIFIAGSPAAAKPAPPSPAESPRPESDSGTAANTANAAHADAPPPSRMRSRRGRASSPLMPTFALLDRQRP
jgi:hypothetical protein